MPLWRRRGRGNDEWSAHEARAGHLVASIVGEQESSIGRVQIERARAWQDELLSRPGEVVGSALLLLVRACRDGQLPSSVPLYLTDLHRRDWTITRPDALLAASTAVAAPDGWDAGWALKVAELMLRRTAPEGELPDHEAELIRTLIASVDARSHLAGEDRSLLRTGLLKLLPSADTGGVDVSVIAGGDGWARVVVPELTAAGLDASAVNALLRHLATTTGSKPTAKWLKSSEELLVSGEAVKALRLLLEQVMDAEPVTAFSRYEGCDVPLVLGTGNTDLVRGAAWATISVDEE